MTDETPTENQNPGQPTDGLARPRSRPWWKRWKLLVVLGLVFTAGVIAGGAGATCVITDRYCLRPRNTKALPQRMTRLMQWKLDLTDEQARQVETVLTQRLGTLLAMHRNMRPQVEAEIQRTAKEVEQYLTPQQAAKWRAWFTKRFRKHWPPGPPQQGEPAQEEGAE